tara:strand:+ start:2836 stop:3327 length:492 start_codon:yes stop_codon:yes gene_type:complete
MKTYLIVNLNNKMRYIGQTTKCIYKRFKEHMKRDKSKYNPRFASDINKGHRFKVRQINGDEKYLIKKYNATKCEKYYNIAEGGIGGNMGNYKSFPNNKHAAVFVNIYNYKTNKLIAEKVSVKDWDKNNNYHHGNLSETAKFKRKQTNGIFARYHSPIGEFLTS